MLIYSVWFWHVYILMEILNGFYQKLWLVNVSGVLSNISTVLKFPAEVSARTALFYLPVQFSLLLIVPQARPRRAPVSSCPWLSVPEAVSMWLLQHRCCGPGQPRPGWLGAAAWLLGAWLWGCPVPLQHREQRSSCWTAGTLPLCSGLLELIQRVPGSITTPHDFVHLLKYNTCATELHLRFEETVTII